MGLRHSLALPVVLLLMACVVACPRRERPNRADWRVMQLYGGGSGIEILRSPARVEGFRISKEAEPAEQADRFIGRIPAVGSTVTFPDAVAQAVSEILLDPETYDFAHAKADKNLDPTVGLRFSLDTSRVDVALCFKTRQILIYRYGKLSGFEDFDDAEDRLRELLKTGFPDDTEIQGW